MASREFVHMILSIVTYSSSSKFIVDIIDRILSKILSSWFTKLFVVFVGRKISFLQKNGRKRNLLSESIQVFSFNDDF